MQTNVSRATTAVLLAVLLSAFGNCSVSQADEPAALCGVCFATDLTTGEPEFLPLESTEVALDIKPGLLEAEVVQTFSNHGETALEAIYRYPLPERATLTGFELRYADRVVRSAVREKKQARADYETAKEAGAKAALLEQADPMLFSTSVANFLPGETVKVVLRFIQPLKLTARAIEVRFPMVAGDKYFPVGATPGVMGNAAPNPTRISAGALAARHVYAFDIQVAGIPVGEITSPSHAIHVAPAANETYLVSLAEEVTIPDRDFVLRIATAADARVQPILVTQSTRTGEYGMLTVFPPDRPTASVAAMRPRDVLFLLDRSGSMRGLRFQSARRGLAGCLQALLPDDRFQIVVFDDQFDFYQRDWVQASRAAVDRAVDHVENLATRGGTQMQPALAASLAAFEPNARNKTIIFLTDGDVGNPDTLLQLIEDNVGDVRLFTFGIGSAPNAALIEKMAELGRGQARFIANDADIEAELDDLFATLDAPVLSNVRLSLLDSRDQAMKFMGFPEKLPDVFFARPIQAVFRTIGQAPAAVLVEGEQDGKRVEYRIAMRPTPLRGNGVEKEFGQRWYAELQNLNRRTRSANERMLVEREMLDTALQFELVTELTSRVAIASEVSRQRNAPLNTQTVGQYAPADQAAAGAVDGEVVELSPFLVEAGEDSGYTATETLAGTRIRTNLSDVAASINVVTQQFLQDIAATNVEDVLAYVMEPEDETAVAHADTDARLLGGMPIATIVDPATVSQIVVQPSGPAWSDVQQLHAGSAVKNVLTARIADEGAASVSLQAATDIGGRGEFPVLAIASWNRSDNDRASVTLDARRQFADTHVATNLQWNDLTRYGEMRLARTSVRHRWADDLELEASVAWHQLQRDNPHQFTLGSLDARIDGLGFYNLDLLTADVTQIEDRIASLRLSGSCGDGGLRHLWSTRLQWHRQTADLDVRPAEAIEASRQTSASLEGAYRLELADQRLGLSADVNATRYATPDASVEHLSAQTASLGATWQLTGELTAFAHWNHAEFLPWVPSGIFHRDGAVLTSISLGAEERDGGELGLRVQAWDGRFGGSVALFRESVSNHAYRDWAWELAHPGRDLVALAGGGARLPVSYSLAPGFEREGCIVEWSLTPWRSLRCVASWYFDWRNEGPNAGGNRRGSLAACYSFREGALDGFFVGGGINYRNEQVFDDGFVLRGGVRFDAVLGYRIRPFAGDETLVQVNLKNVTGQAGAATRFAPDHGRQIMLTIARRF